MRKKILLVVIAFLLFGCETNGYKLSKLKREITKFNNLPIEVKQYFYNPEAYKKVDSSVLTFINLDILSRYKIKSVQTNLPWIYKQILVDIRKNISYEIETETPDPFIIFNNKLYSPNSFNLYTLNKDDSITEFTCYTLH